MVNTLSTEKCLPVASSSKSIHYKALSVVKENHLLQQSRNTLCYNNAV